MRPAANASASRSALPRLASAAFARARGGGRPAVEARCELEERRIAPRAHRVQYFGGGVLDGGILGSLERKQGLERALETRISRGETPNPHSPPSPMTR